MTSSEHTTPVMLRANQFKITKRELKRLEDRAYRAQKRNQSEVCGALIADDLRNLTLAFLKNSSDKAGSFKIDEHTVHFARSQARLDGNRVVGWFHSHPISIAVPTEGDIQHAPINSLMLVYDVCGREARLWRVHGTRQRKIVTEHAFIIHGATK